MSVYKDMANDAGYRGEEAEQMARFIEEDHMRQTMEQQEQEPDQIDMMNHSDTRRMLRETLAALEQANARVREAFFAGWLDGKSTESPYKGESDRAFEKFLTEVEDPSNG